jgi:hypothetical protein
MPLTDISGNDNIIAGACACFCDRQYRFQCLGLRVRDGLASSSRFLGLYAACFMGHRPCQKPCRGQHTRRFLVLRWLHAYGIATRKREDSWIWIFHAATHRLMLVCSNSPPRNAEPSTLHCVCRRRHSDRHAGIQQLEQEDCAKGCQRHGKLSRNAKKGGWPNHGEHPLA